MKGPVRKAGLWLAVGLGLLAVALGLFAGRPGLLRVPVVTLAELSFLEEHPELKATLLRWEQEAPQKVKAEIKILRTGYSLAKGRACDRLGEMGPEATGAILALIETLRDTTRMKVKQGRRRYEITSPAVQAVRALAKIGEVAVVPLIAALRDENGDVRYWAAQALKPITGEWFGTDAARWRRWWEQHKEQEAPQGASER